PPPSAPLPLHDALPIFDRLEALDVPLLEFDRALEVRQEEPEVRRLPRLAPDRLGHHRRPGGLGAQLERYLARLLVVAAGDPDQADRKSTRLNSSHQITS